MPEQAKEIVVFGIQYTIKCINDLFNENFFFTELRNSPLADDKKKLEELRNNVCGEFKKHLDSYLGVDYDISNFEELWDLGYLPLEIRGLDEGTIIEPKIPILTFHNTDKRFFWLTNYLETLISTTLWKPMHSASLSYAFSKIAKKWRDKTCKDFNTSFQTHDFSMRGMQSLEASIGSALGWMVCSNGTDTLPVLQASEYYYNTSNIGFSVPASEHAVMTAYGKEDEIGAFKRILDMYPTGIVSVVSDSFDLWQVVSPGGYCDQLKEQILSRDGKLVVRPDSGNPVDIVCGSYIKEYKSLKEAEDVFEDELYSSQEHGERYINIDKDKIVKVGDKYHKLKADIDWNRYDKRYYFIESIDFTNEGIMPQPSEKGVVELLWEVFGGTINEQGYKVLDSHIGVIYGDSISLDKMEQICSRLEQKGFASCNVVFGVGSFSMGYATRDNQGSAVKATYVEVNGQPRNIFKDPITDDGTKKSATGLLAVFDGKLKEQCSWGEVNSVKNELKLRFRDGEMFNFTTLTEIRERLNG